MTGKGGAGAALRCGYRTVPHRTRGHSPLRASTRAGTAPAATTREWVELRRRQPIGAIATRPLGRR